MKYVKGYIDENTCADGNSHELINADLVDNGVMFPIVTCQKCGYWRNR